MAGIGKDALLDGLITRMLDIGSVRLRNDGAKARLNALGARLEAFIVSYNLGIAELAGVSVGTTTAVGGTVYPTALTAVWTGVTTA